VRQLRGEIAYRRAFIVRMRGVSNKNIDKNELLDIEVHVHDRCTDGDKE